MTTLHLLCAGAAQGLVKALQARFQTEAGADIEGRFGAVGAMTEALLGGQACDVMVVTQAMIDSLVADGRLRAGSSAALGRVRTGVAVKQGEALPDVATPEGLKAALLAASAIYFPDPLRATAGIHFANVMRELGIHDALQPCFRTFPNGATAMREMAACNEAGLIGCTQVSEILYSPGVALVDALPKRFELATVYTAAVSAGAADPALAARFIGLLTGPDAQPLRAGGGIEP
jgi:molybdate transport system substrate-binding protein